MQLPFLTNPTTNSTTNHHYNRLKLRSPLIRRPRILKFDGFYQFGQWMILCKSRSINQSDKIFHKRLLQIQDPLELSSCHSTWCWADNICDDDPLSGRESTVRGNCVYIVPDNDEGFFPGFIRCYSLDEGTCTKIYLLPKPHISRHSGFYWLMPHNYHRATLSREDNRQIMEELEDLSKGVMEMQLVVQHKEAEESILYDIALDIIELIQQKMHLFDYWNSRLSCKAFATASLVPTFYKTNNNNVLLPLFVTYKIGANKCKIRDICRDDDSRLIDFHLSCDAFRVDFSKNGWVITKVDKSESTQFFNLFKRTRGNYPCIKDFYGSVVAFSTDPTLVDCLTIVITSEHKTVEVYCHQHGCEKWDLHTYVHDEESCFSGVNSNTSPVFCEGAFYVLDYAGNLVEFKLVKGKVNW